MEALKTANCSPLSVLCERRSESKRRSSLPILSSPKSPRPISQESFLRSFNGGLALLTSVLSSSAAPAQALSYEEALQQSVSSSSSSSDFDLNSPLDGIINFATENPLVIAGGVAVLAVPLVLSQILNKEPKSWGVESAKNAYTKLGADENAQLLDIRAPSDARKVGSPNVKGLGKRPISVVYKGEDKSGFLKKLALKFKDPENTTLLVLDKFGGNSELVAELVALNGFKAAYAIKDGAEGPRGWLNSGLPWIEPPKTPSLDLSDLIESIRSIFGENSDGLSVSLGLAAATGVGLLAFSEIETILQLLGSAALVQFASKKLLFAEDRKQTIKQVDEFLTTKVAPNELVDEIKQIGKAFLPSSESSKALPAPTEAAAPVAATATATATAPAPAPVSASTPEAESESVPDTKAAMPPPPPPQVNSTSLKSHPRPLSPYASYPDLKPPSSPTPSQP